MAPADYNGRRLDTLPRWAVLELIEAGATAIQVEAGLEVDGKAGPNTLAAMHRPFAIAPTRAEKYGRAILDVALEELGHGEVGGNNAGLYVAKYHRRVVQSGDLGPWCASFTSWCCEEAARRLGVALPFKRSGAAKALARNVVKGGGTMITDRDAKPQAGDLILFNRGSVLSWQGHIGIVESCEDGIVQTVEGNVGKYPAKVRRLSHDVANSRRWLGYARPPEV